MDAFHPSGTENTGFFAPGKAKEGLSVHCGRIFYIPAGIFISTLL
jgi:hypothetical protein